MPVPSDVPYAVRTITELTCVFCGRSASYPRELLTLIIMSVGDDVNVCVHVSCFQAALEPSLIRAVDLSRAILNPAD
jgi:hypothetical protein